MPLFYLARHVTDDDYGFIAQNIHLRSVITAAIFGKKTLKSFGQNMCAKSSGNDSISQKLFEMCRRLK